MCVRCQTSGTEGARSEGEVFLRQLLTARTWILLFFVFPAWPQRPQVHYIALGKVSAWDHAISPFWPPGVLLAPSQLTLKF